jgi:RNA polymerase sigma-70 factor, ECF subfamily
MTLTTSAIWNNFNKELFRFIKKRVKDNDIANDLLQDIFVKIHLNLSTLKDTEKLTSWIYQITRNSILDYYKKNRRLTEIPDNISEMEEPETFNDHFANCMKPFVDQLPQTYREAIFQTELGQLSQKEFAEKEDISYSGAKSRIQRGRKQLFEIFNECCQVSTDKYGNIWDYRRRNKDHKC